MRELERRRRQRARRAVAKARAETCGGEGEGGGEEDEELLVILEKADEQQSDLNLAVDKGSGGALLTNRRATPSPTTAAVAGEVTEHFVPDTPRRAGLRSRTKL